MENRDDVEILFLYFRKAFDIVNHKNICVKLAALGISLQVVD